MRSSGESFTFYTDVPSILQAARSKSIPLALASRTHAPSLAVSLLKMLHVPPQNGINDTPKRAYDFFTYQEIFPGDKKTHMNKLSKTSGVAHKDILFFDDETRNRNVESLGVCFWLVRDGVTKDEVDNGVHEWRRRQGLSRD